MGEEKIEELIDEMDGPKLSPCVPDKVLKMWYIEDKKLNFEVKKVSEIKSAKAITKWDGKAGIITNSVGVSFQVYKTFDEAAEVSIYKKIEDKKKIWDAHAKACIMLNDQLSVLYDQLEKIHDKKIVDQSE